MNSKNSTKRKGLRKKKIIKGGAFTGNQIYDLFSTFQSEFDGDFTKLSIDNIVPLDKEDHDLYNEDCHVFYINNSKSNNTEESNNTECIKFSDVRFVIIHRGTYMNLLKDPVRTIKSMFLNPRNMITPHLLQENDYTNKIVSSQRTIIAKNGHERLLNYLKELYEKNKENGNLPEEKKNMQPIFNIIKKIKLIPHDKYGDNIFLNTAAAVRELLANTLTTIGHSQGAEYAYLYGSQGKETIVINPAPSQKRKPDNIYILSKTGDVVSSASNFRDPLGENRMVVLPSDGKSTHTIDGLKDNQSIIGNLVVYDRDSSLTNPMRSDGVRTRSDGDRTRSDGDRTRSDSDGDRKRSVSNGSSDGSTDGEDNDHFGGQSYHKTQSSQVKECRTSSKRSKSCKRSRLRGKTSRRKRIQTSCRRNSRG